MIDYHRVNRFRIERGLSWRALAEEVERRTGRHIEPHTLRKRVLVGGPFPRPGTRTTIMEFAILLEKEQHI